MLGNASVSFHPPGQVPLAAVEQGAVILVIIAKTQKKKKAKYGIIRNVQNNIQKDNYR